MESLTKSIQKRRSKSYILKKRTAKVILYKVEEIKQMLEKNSFEVLKIFTRYSIRDYNGGRSAIFVARKI